MTQKPSVGRIVHFHDSFGMTGRNDNAPQPIAALITGVLDENFVMLTLFRPGSIAEPLVTPVSRGTNPGSWSFPERV